MVKPPLRTKSIGFKVSEEEYTKLDSAAQTSGRTLGEWRVAHPFGFALSKGAASLLALSHPLYPFFSILERPAHPCA